MLGKYLLLDDRGAWPAVERDMTLLPETESLRWRPARELPDAPEVSDTPMLPMPFTARQLAAFMLAGTGVLVADFYGDWSDGPDRDSLNHIDPDSNARRAVVEAFAAYRLAQEKVGELDLTTQTRRDLAHKAYWQEPSNQALLSEFDEAQAAWDAAYQDWLTAMVRCLLVPEVAHDAVQVAPVGAEPEPMPVIKKEGYVLKKAAAIKKYSDTWSTIRADFQHANENGLSKAAKAPLHGEWYETALLAWADSKGKRDASKPVNEVVNSVFNLAGTIHTMQG